MSKVSYEEILSIQRKINIVDIVGDYVRLSQKGRNFFGICPFHDDHNPSMSVSNEKQMYKCFVCGASGNVFNFVMDYEKVSYLEAVKIVANKVGIDVDIGNNSKLEVKSPLYKIYDLAVKYYQNYLNTSSGKIAKNYLDNRSITDDIIKSFQIGLSPNNNELTKLLKSKEILDNDIISAGISIRKSNDILDIYHNRIMFPLWDLNGNVVGFSGRVYDDSSTSKYVNTMETDIFKKGNLLYNYHNAKEEARKEKQIIVVEGFMDVIRLYSIGIKNVVATMGTAITHNQASLISKLSYNIILMFDGDKAGEKATLSAIEELNNKDVNIKIIRLENNLDPDEYILKNGKDKMLYHLSHGISLFSYKTETLKDGLNFNDSNDVSKYINLLKPELEKITDDIVRNLEIKKISEFTKVDENIIASKLDIQNKDVKIVKSSEKHQVKINKYEKASTYILFYMINYNNIIDYYYNNLSFLPNSIDRELANEIVLFYKKFESFNFNDFLVYLGDKNELIKRVIYINDLNLKKEYLMEDIDSYFKSIKEYLNNMQIKKLTEELKNEKNEIIRKEIAKKIVAIKLKENK